MSIRTLPLAIPVSRPLPRRAADAVREALRAVAAAWRAFVQRRALAREIELLAELDPRTLKDIGASDEFRAYAAARRAAAGLGDLR